MTRVVIDTNVLVSGLLSKRGAPARIVDMTLGDTVVPVISPAVLTEYDDVLSRPELALRAEDVAAVLNYLRLPGAHVVHVDPSEIDHVCADPDDDTFTAAASEGKAAFLITGNPRHFPRSPWRGIRILTPRHFLRVAQPSD